MSEINYWRKCGSCKKDIGFNTTYQLCNVSGCKKHVYCSVDCWDIHNTVMNHKSAWAEENISPRSENATPIPEVSAPRRIIVGTKTPEVQSTGNETEILIVASKLKQYIKDKYDFNTSANVMEVLSKIVRQHSDRAVARAKNEGRKTLMDRDFE
jgi:histone H3/H4